MKKIIIIVFVFTWGIFSSQLNTDSLLNNWNNLNLHDTIRLNSIHVYIINHCRYNAPDSGMIYNEKLLNLAYKNKDSKMILKGMNNKALLLQFMGQINEAIENLYKCIEICEKEDLKKDKAAFYNNLGTIYDETENYNMALDYYYKSLEIYDELDLINNKCNTLSNIGSTYISQELYNEALEYLGKVYLLSKENNYQKGIALSLSNMGSCYSKMGDYKNAMLHLKSALEICELNNMQRGIAFVLIDIGHVYLQLKEIKKAINAYNESLLIAKEKKFTRVVRDVSYELYKIHKKAGSLSNSIYMLEVYNESNEILNDVETERFLAEKTYSYEYNRKVFKDSLLKVEEDHINKINMKLKDAEIDREISKRNGVLLLLIFILLLSVLLFYRFIVVRSQKILIKDQNIELNNAYKELGLKNRQIISSINYSKRIQNTILPNLNDLKGDFNDFFVLSMPKDIVSGDFYWYRTFDDISVIATVDCTGHGVPGGFMSMMGSLLLDKIVQVNNLDTSSILKDLNKEIIRVLNQEGGGEIQDGMDIALCVFDKRNRILSYSGARNGIMIISEDQLKYINADIFSVGGSYSKKSKSLIRDFKTHTITLNENDWVLMCSDGYYDQLGGDQVTSMGMELFKKYIYDCLNSNELKEEYLKEQFNKWRGNLPQIDDVLVLGFKI